MSFFMCSNEELKNKLVRLFYEIGISPKLLGYRYLLKAMMLIIESNQIPCGQGKRVFELIAKEYEVSAATIDRNIRHAIEKAHKSGKLMRLNELVNSEPITKNYCPGTCQLMAVLFVNLDDLYDRPIERPMKIEDIFSL